MNVYSGNDEATRADIKACSERIDSLAEELAMSLHKKNGSRQRSVAIVTSSLASCAVHTLHQMAGVYRVELSQEESQAIAKNIQAALNNGIATILAKVPRVGN